MREKATENPPDFGPKKRQRGGPFEASSTRGILTIGILAKDKIFLSKLIYAVTIDFFRRLIKNGVVGMPTKILSSASAVSISDGSIIRTTVGHLEVFRVMTRPNTISLTRRHPSLINKYFGTYIAKSFTINDRQEILISHYLYMSNIVKDTFYDQLWKAKPVLWQQMSDKELFTISLRFNHLHDYEGDLSLIFEKDLVTLYELSFTLVPGRLIGIAAARALLVARVQGVSKQFEAIRRATKMCHDIAPPYLLMAAAQAIAGALDIGHIAGVSNKEQLTKDMVEPFNYDSFWEKFLAIKTCLNFYVIPMPFSGRPIEQISAVHRRRTRFKRQFKIQIAECVRISFVEKFLKMQPRDEA